jgi:imidazolonepropionase-like amidohydrolase
LHSLLLCVKQKNIKMKKYIIILSSLAFAHEAIAQDNISPAKKHVGYTLIKNGTVHTGTGEVLQNTSVLIHDGKIEKIGKDITAPDAVVTDATGMHIYPGFILANTITGLKEIASQVKGTNDYNELGDLNPNVKSIVAYNADSKIINTLRSNGILFANVVPQGSLIAGTSSVVNFDAWNYEDALYKKDNGLHFYMPSLLVRPNRFGAEPQGDPLKAAKEKIEMVKQFFRQAKAYNTGDKPAQTNLKMEAVKGLFDKSQKLFVHCNIVKEMLTAIDFVKEFGFEVTLVGASECWQIAPLLKQNNISVIIAQMHSLPNAEDDDIDQPFKTPATLQKAGVLYAITDEDETTTGRNLMFNAGTAASYGLSKEEALQAITLNAAKIVGIADKSGSIEIGKDANIIISKGDVLDIRTSQITKAFIQGRDINLDDKHKQLYKKYADKYGVR